MKRRDQKCSISLVAQTRVRTHIHTHEVTIASSTLNSLSSLVYSQSQSHIRAKYIPVEEKLGGFNLDLEQREEEEEEEGTWGDSTKLVKCTLV